MTQKVSSRSVASASCWVPRTEQSHILRRITGGQPTITRLLGKLSIISLRIPTKMPDRCTEGRLEKGIRPDPAEPKFLGAQAVPKAHEIGLHPAPVGTPVVRKIPMAPPVAEIEIQAKSPNLAETREMPRDPTARVKQTPVGPLPQARARDVAAVEVPHPAAVAVEGAIIAWISCPEQIRCPMQTEIMLKMP